MDKFKKHLQENAEGLDCESPSTSILENVRIHMERDRRSIFRRLRQNRYLRAACIIGILAAAISVFLIRTRRKEINPTKIVLTSKTRVPQQQSTEILNSRTKDGTKEEKHGTEQNKSLAKKPVKKVVVNDPEEDFPSEKASMPQELENEMDFAINRYVKIINTTPLLAESPTYFDYFVQEYKRIDKAKSAIEESIQKHGVSDVLFQQLVNIGQQKLKILKDLEKEIRKINSFYQERAGLRGTEPNYIQL